MFSRFWNDPRFHNGFRGAVHSPGVQSLEIHLPVQPPDVITRAAVSMLTKPLSPASPAPAQEGESPLMQTIAALSGMEVDDSLAAERDELLLLFSEAIERLESFARKAEAIAATKTAADLAMLQEACRNARQERDRLELEHRERLSEFNTAVAERKSAQNRLIEAEGSIPAADTWPTKQQVRQAEKRVESARAALHEAADHETELLNMLNDTAYELHDAEEQLARLTEQERLLREPRNYFTQLGLHTADAATQKREESGASSVQETTVFSEA
jgi:hypothetical protein